MPRKDAEARREYMREYRKRPHAVAAQRESHRKFRGSLKGKAAIRDYDKKYNASESGRSARRSWRGSEAGRSSVRRYLESEKGRETQKRAQSKFLATEHGREYRARLAARRRVALSEQYEEVVVRIRRGEERCYSCLALADEADHVLPIGLAKLFGLLDVVDEYVHPICRSCHVEKTRLDADDIRRVKAAA